MPVATGEFEVRLLPAPNASLTEGSGIGRMTLDKRYHGLLEAEGYGEFLSYRSSVPTSAVYVAIEKVTGTLEGRQGGFALQHQGVMGGEFDGLRIIIVPDSGTDGLKGLRGKMDVRIEDGKHFYSLDYSFT
jgi:hypothetical protein